MTAYHRREAIQEAFDEYILELIEKAPWKAPWQNDAALHDILELVRHWSMYYHLRDTIVQFYEATPKFYVELESATFQAPEKFQANSVMVAHDAAFFSMINEDLLILIRRYMARDITLRFKTLDIITE